MVYSEIRLDVYKSILRNLNLNPAGVPNSVKTDRSENKTWM